LSIRDSRAPSSRFGTRRLPPTRRKPKPAAASSSSSDPFVIYDAEEDEDDNDNDEDDNGNEIDSERVQLLGNLRAKPIGGHGHGHVAIDLVDESAALPPAW